jgi:hypothetical protein
MDPPDDDFVHKELDDYIFKEFIDSSDSDINDDKDVEVTVVMSIQEEMSKKEEHVLNLKGSVKGMIVVALSLLCINAHVID